MTRSRRGNNSNSWDGGSRGRDKAHNGGEKWNQGRGGGGGNGGAKSGWRKDGNGGGGGNGSKRSGNGGGGGRQFQKFVDMEARGKERNWGNHNWHYKHDNDYGHSDKIRRRDGFRGTSHLYYNEQHCQQTAPFNSFEQPQIYSNPAEPSTQTNPTQQQVLGSSQTQTATVKDLLPTEPNPNITSNPPTLSEGALSMKESSFTAQNAKVTCSPSTSDITRTTKDSSIAPSANETPKLIHIKQEKIKTEKKSASSASSDTSSSSEDEVPTIPSTSKSGNTTTKVVSSDVPLNIKLKPLAIAVSKTVVDNTSNTKKPAPTSSSSSSSSSSSEDEVAKPPTPPPAVILPPSKHKSKKKKNIFEDDVVCMGNLENKITLDDDDDDDEHNNANSDGGNSDSSSNETKTKKKSKKSARKSEEQCMLCDKKGHTSFQCQMICKNCSAPYHGFRTCPQPANLNIMLQLFMEFCMQQLQNFQPDRQFQQMLSNVIDTRETVPQPLVGSPTSTQKNIKRKKQTKSKEIYSKTSSSKKRKLNTKKTRSKNRENNDDVESTTSDSSEGDDGTSDSDDDSSSEGFQTPTKPKNKQSKSKHKISNTLSSFNHLTKFMANPLNLNGMPNITTAANTPLNSVLLTQMFQNAIGSMNHQRS